MSHLRRPHRGAVRGALRGARPLRTCPTRGAAFSGRSRPTAMWDRPETRRTDVAKHRPFLSFAAFALTRPPRSHRRFRRGLRRRYWRAGRRACRLAAPPRGWTRALETGGEGVKIVCALRGDGGARAQPAMAGGHRAIRPLNLAHEDLAPGRGAPAGRIPRPGRPARALACHAHRAHPDNGPVLVHSRLGSKSVDLHAGPPLAESASRKVFGTPGKTKSAPAASSERR